MRSFGLRQATMRTVTLGTAVALAGTLTVGLATELPAAAATVCPKVLFIGAAGSGEISGLGPEMQGFYDVLSSSIPANLSIAKRAVLYGPEAVPVLYPTPTELLQLLSTNFPLALSAIADSEANHLDVFSASIDRGIQGVLDAIQFEATSCSATRIVLGGFSQGAMVVHQVLDKLANRPDLMSKIAYTALAADGVPTYHVERHTAG